MEKYQKELNAFYKENATQGWTYWSPLSILARLTEEVGEFARLVNHIHGDKKKKGIEKEQDQEEEMGDIIYALICYANSSGLDLDRAIGKSFAKMTGRDKDRYSKNVKK